jgi:hypothetical protein
MKAKPWSFTGLEQADQCLKQFNEVRNLKRFPFEADSEEAKWGRYVHKAFEDRQGTRIELPQELSHHEKFMQRMEAWDGFFFTEQKVALDKQLRPVSDYFSDRVWWRGVIDYTKVEYLAQRARIVDYKTGKRKPKPGQLVQNALWTFAMYPDINVVDAFFYWTQESDYEKAVERYVYGRAEIPQLWAQFIPSLTNLKTAYDTDTWPPKPSGLCYGWCPVTDCKHWKPKKEKR